MSMRCNCCNGDSLKVLIDLGELPVAHNLLDNEYDKDKIVHPLVLHYCERCGFVQISDPIKPSELYSEYNYCFSNWKNEPQIPQQIKLINKWVSNKNSKILEIGCNDGVFIAPMIMDGYTNIIGVEANPYAAREAKKAGATIINDFFTKDSVLRIKEQTGSVDLLILRAVLEHIPDLSGFFEAADCLLDNNKYLFIEVPDFDTAAIIPGDCSSIWEEHPNYFTKQSLDYILRKHGYTPLEWDYFDFSGGAMCVIAQKSDDIAGGDDAFCIDDIDLSLYESFSSRVLDYANKLKASLSEAKQKGFGVYIYGTGCRACTLVNGVGLKDYIDKAIDDQPEKQGKYMPGCRILIADRDSVLNNDKGKSVILLAVNHENEEAVKQKIEDYGQRVVISLFAPNDLLNEVQKMRRMVSE